MLSSQGYFLKEKNRGGIEGDILHLLSGGLDFFIFYAPVSHLSHDKRRMTCGTVVKTFNKNTHSRCCLLFEWGIIR